MDNMYFHMYLLADKATTKLQNIFTFIDYDTICRVQIQNFTRIVASLYFALII